MNKRANKSRRVLAKVLAGALMAGASALTIAVVTTPATTAFGAQTPVGRSCAAAGHPGVILCPVRRGLRPGPDSALARAPVPDGLRAAVHETLGARALRPASTFRQAGPVDNAASGDFGESVAVSGDTAVVGAAGAAYVYASTGPGTPWSLQAGLADPSGQATDDFGASVAISGSTIVVGAQGTDSDSGAAYVYTNTGPGTSWSLQTTLNDPDSRALDYFGASVAISGSTIVVGAPHGSRSASDYGFAYVYLDLGASGRPSAEAADPGFSASDDFGASVAISGSTAVVGAPGVIGTPGAAYVYQNVATSMASRTTLADPDGAGSDSFGASVAISGSTVVVGAPGTNSDVGKAYAFANSGASGSPSATLTAPDAGSFGASVAVSGPTVVAGAPGTNSSAGEVYVFEDTITVTSPGRRSSTAGKRVAGLQMEGSSDFGFTLTWSATGLPSGLSINHTSGLISGKPTRVGTYRPMVTATDQTGASGSVSFRWSVAKRHHSRTGTAAA